MQSGHEEFVELINSLQARLESLVAMKPVTAENLPRPVPQKCIYMFSESGSHLYVGRTKKLRQRMGNHCGNGADQNQASFAFKLAREATGSTEASHTKAGSKIALMSDATFRRQFERSKERIRRMDLRYIEEPEPLRQALLEIYIAVVLRTKYNDFDTH